MKSTKLISAIVGACLILGGIIAGVMYFRGVTPKIVEMAEIPQEEDVRPLIIVAEQYPPFEYEENGEVIGINVEIIKRILERMDVSYEIKVMSWARAWKMIEKGAADAASAASYKPFREPYVYYTEDQKVFETTGKLPKDYLWITEYVFFTKKTVEGAVEVTSYDQIKEDGYRVGVIRDHSYFKEFLDAKLDVHTYVNAKECFEALDTREIDLYVMDKTVGLATIKDMGVSDRFTYFPRILHQKPYLLLFSKNSGYPDVENVMKKFYEELLKMKETGEYQEIYDKYTKVVPWKRTETRPLLIVGEEFIPFEYEEDGEVKGINAEVIGSIMKKLQIPYEIKILPWARVWKMIEKGGADAATSTSYKPFRATYLYYLEDQKAFETTGKIPRDYLWVTEYVFFIRKIHEGALKFESYEQLKKDKYRVGVIKGNTYFKEFWEVDLDLHEYASVRDCFVALGRGEIDIYIADKTVGLATIKDNRLSGTFVCLPTILKSKPYLLPFVKNSGYADAERVMEKFYEELRKMKETGEYQEIYDKYTK